MSCELNICDIIANPSPQSVYSEQAPFPPREPLSDDVFDAAIAQRPTIIYYHGNVSYTSKLTYGCRLS